MGNQSSRKRAAKCGQKPSNKPSKLVECGALSVPTESSSSSSSSSSSMIPNVNKSQVISLADFRRGRFIALYGVEEEKICGLDFTKSIKEYGEDSVLVFQYPEYLKVLESEYYIERAAQQNLWKFHEREFRDDLEHRQALCELREQSLRVRKRELELDVVEARLEALRGSTSGLPALSQK